MQWTPETAEAIAREAHATQTDKAGEPYVGHVERVSRYCRRVADVAGLHEAEKQAVVQAAWLHDLIEDNEHTGWTLDRLVAVGAPNHVVDLVRVVTNNHQSYDEYFAQVQGHRLARIIKIADMADNLDPARLARLEPDTQERLRRKYERHWLDLTRPLLIVSAS